MVRIRYRSALPPVSRCLITLFVNRCSSVAVTRTCILLLYESPYCATNGAVRPKHHRDEECDHRHTDTGDKTPKLGCETDFDAGDGNDNSDGNRYEKPAE